MVKEQQTGATDGAAGPATNQSGPGNATRTLHQCDMWQRVAEGVTFFTLSPQSKNIFTCSCVHCWLIGGYHQSFD